LLLPLLHPLLLHAMAAALLLELPGSRLDMHAAVS
jgi:hypothetical protein